MIPVLKQLSAPGSPPLLLFRCFSVSCVSRDLSCLLWHTVSFTYSIVWLSANHSDAIVFEIAFTMLVTEPSTASDKVYRGKNLLDEEWLCDRTSVSVDTHVKVPVLEGFVLESWQIHIFSDIECGLEYGSLFHFPTFLSTLHPAHLFLQSTISTYLAYQLLC